MADPSGSSEPAATIMDPAVHMENLTGLTFDEVGEEDNGSPKAMLTIQHVVGRRHGAGSEEDLADIIRGDNRVR